MRKIAKHVAKKAGGKVISSIAKTKVPNLIDLFAESISTYLNQKYKIEKNIEDAKAKVVETLYTLKREFVKTIVETLFLVTGLLSLLIGLILYLTNFIPLEWILIGYGGIATVIMVLSMKLHS